MGLYLEYKITVCFSLVKWMFACVMYQNTKRRQYFGCSIVCVLCKPTKIHVMCLTNIPISYRNLILLRLLAPRIVSCLISFLFVFLHIHKKRTWSQPDARSTMCRPSHCPSCRNEQRRKPHADASIQYAILPTNDRIA